MLATLDITALAAGIVLVGFAARRNTGAVVLERAGGALLVGALVGLGVLVARAGS